MAATAAGPGCLFSRHRYPQSQFSPSCPGFSVIIPPPRVAKANFRAGRVSTSAPPVHKIFGRPNVAAKLKATLNQPYAYADISRSQIPWKQTICKVKVDELKPSKESGDKREGNSSPGPSKSKPSDDRRAKSTASGGSGKAHVTEGRGNFGQKSPRQSKRRRFGAWEWQWSSKTQEIAVLIFQLVLVFFLMRVLRPRGAQHPDHAHVTVSYVNVPFSEFLTRVKSNQVQRVEVDGERFTFHMKPAVLLNTETETDENTMGMAVTTKKRIIYTTSQPTDMKTPYDLMLENHVAFEAPDLPLGNSVISATLAILYVALVAGLLNQLLVKFLQNPTGPSRKHKAGARHKTKSGNQGGLVMFADVAGVDEAKEELEEIVGYLQNPHRYARLGARPPRGVLLVGPPGAGKTLLAKAVAGEANVPFISCSASEFVELYVGMGASHVRDMFARAKKAAPSIIFIDEIDAVAKGRDNRLRTINNDEQEQTLNQLLTEMDGFDSNSIVIVLGATNRADVLDHALLRTGRFDRIVKVEPPDRRGREAILKVHISKKELPLAADVDLNVIATTTTGFSGADLANLVNEAALLAGRANKLVVEMEDFAWAVERSVAGIEKKRSVLKRSEKAAVARHEVGHAVVGTAVANILPGQLQVEKLSILPRSGRAPGFTYTPPVGEDRHLLFVDELRGRLVTLFGGRAAEEVVYSGRVSTGALDDIKHATNIAYNTVAEYGLNPAVGPISLSTLSSGGLHEPRSAIPWTKKQGHMVDLVQREVKSLLQSALATALIVVRSNPTVVEGLGAQLEVNEKVEGEDLQEWLKLVVAPKELTAFVKGEFVLPQKTAVIFQSPDKG